MKKTEIKILSVTLACWGLIFITSGVILNIQDRTIVEKKYSLSIKQNQVRASKTNEIKLKDMKSEINTPLSVDVKDYLENIENLDDSVLKSLKLDTSNVKIQEAGSYTYTISYNRKKYNGTYIVTEKELPNVILTLKNITVNKDSTLDKTLSTYIVEVLTTEIAENIKLDLSNVNTSIEGTYQYGVIYNNKLYTANITVVAPQTTTKPSEEEKQETNNQDSTETDPTTDTTPESTSEPTTDTTTP